VLIRKKKEKNSVKKRSPQFVERKSGSLLENVNASKEMTSLKEKLEKKEEKNQEPQRRSSINN